jgi:hypothetical protein
VKSAYGARRCSGEYWGGGPERERAGAVESYAGGVRGRRFGQREIGKRAL